MPKLTYHYHPYKILESECDFDKRNRECEQLLRVYPKIASYYHHITMCGNIYVYHTCHCAYDLFYQTSGIVGYHYDKIRADHAQLHAELLELMYRPIDCNI